MKIDAKLLTTAFAVPAVIGGAVEGKLMHDSGYIGHVSGPAFGVGLAGYVATAASVPGALLLHEGVRSRGGLGLVATAGAGVGILVGGVVGSVTAFDVTPRLAPEA
ncbi:MAG: hypothetical protein JWN41_1755 [Thermoleophilia bacterium]|nr:hypothetical protein [Thermoleophilia bacterium]